MRSKRSGVKPTKRVSRLAIRKVAGRVVSRATKKGQQEGHAEGYQRGYAEGLAAGRDEVALRVQKLDQIVAFMHQPLEQLDNAVEEQLTWLATEIARQLVRRELRSSPGEIVAVVREAVALLPVASAGIQVRLHPEDAQLIREVLSLGRIDEPVWRIIEDQTLSRGVPGQHGSVTD